MSVGINTRGRQGGQGRSVALALWQPERLPDRCTRRNAHVRNCAIDTNTTPTGTPTVRASTTVVHHHQQRNHPFNGRSVGGLAIRLGRSSSMRDRASTAMGALRLQRRAHRLAVGPAINPALGGEGARSLINATGLAVSLNGAGNNVAARAINAATVALLKRSITYAGGGGAIWLFGLRAQATSCRHP